MKKVSYLIPLLIIGFFCFLFLAVFRIDTRVVLVNDLNHAVRLRNLDSSSGINDPFISKSWILESGKKVPNYLTTCLYIEDTAGKIHDSVYLKAGLIQLLKLAYTGTQRTVSLAGQHTACPIPKESVKICYMGKEGVTTTANCP